MLNFLFLGDRKAENTDKYNSPLDTLKGYVSNLLEGEFLGHFN
jgi:hypothetical protein